MEWKNLEIDNLPPDILTGDYEFYWLYNGSKHGAFNFNDQWDGLRLLLDLEDEKHQKLYYRKPEPKQPTHEEIMTKWWKATSAYLNNDVWFKVIKYVNKDKTYWINDNNSRSKQWFINCESADIPPEE